LNFLQQLSIRQKNWLIASVSGFVTIATFYLAFELTVSAVSNERRMNIKSLTESAYSLIDHSYKRYQAGEISLSEAKEEATESIRPLRYGKNGYFFVYQSDGTALMHPIKPSLEGTDMSGMEDPNGVMIMQELANVSKNGKAGFVSYQWAIPSSDELGNKTSYAMGFAPWNWFVGSGTYDEDIYDTVVSTISRSKGLVALSVTFFVAMLVLLTFINRDTLLQILRIKGHLEDFERGDFSKPIHADGRDEFAQMLYSLSEVQSSMCSTLGELSSTASSVRLGIEEIASKNQDLAGSTKQQAQNISHSNQNLFEAASSVKDNNQRLKEASDAAENSQKTATKGEQVVRQAISAMDAITASSEQVTDIVNVIDGIAFQTNLLALNAAVEAARAGEQGRGFAVVATEVRSLASRSAASASEIKALIEQSVSNVQAGSKLVTDSGEILQEILTSSRRVSNLISKISSSTSEQTASIEMSSKSMNDVDSFVQQNNSMVDHVAVSSESLREEAQSLLRLVERFEIGRVA